MVYYILINFEECSRQVIPKHKYRNIASNTPEIYVDILDKKQ